MTRLKRKKSAPGPRGHHLIGSILDVRRDRIKFITQATAAFGDFVEFRMGPKRLFLLSHPDHAKHVLATNHLNYRKGLGLAEAIPLFGTGLLTAAGSQWSNDRELLQSAFQPDRLPAYAPRIVAATRGLLNKWEAHDRNGVSFDVAREMARLTLEILGDTLLGADLRSRADALLENMEIVTSWAMKQMASLVRLPLFLPTLAHVRVRRALRDLISCVDTMIQTHHPGSGQRILDLLMPDGADGLQALELKRIRDHLLTFLVAGHETTAATLAWTWWLLAQHPEVEQRLLDELDQQLCGQTPQYKDLPRLTYLRAVMHEAARLYPPVWMLSRVAVADDQIDGYRIPAGADVLISLYTLQRHPSFWPDPDRFSPDRFAGDQPTRAAGYAFIPFGAGPRSCIGATLGLVEASFVMAMILPRFSIRVRPGCNVRPEAMLTLRPSGFVANVKSRNVATRQVAVGIDLVSGVKN